MLFQNRPMQTCSVLSRFVRVLPFCHDGNGLAENITYLWRWRATPPSWSLCAVQCLIVFPSILKTLSPVIMRNWLLTRFDFRQSSYGKFLFITANQHIKLILQGRYCFRFLMCGLLIIGQFITINRSWTRTVELCQ